LFKPAKFLDAWLRFRTERCDTPGIAVTIVRKGRVLFDQAYGYADLEKREALTTRHLFRVASHSKSFTAVAILQLAASGKLSIDEPAAQHLPWLRKHKDRRFVGVTARQLLSHGGGVIRDGLDSDHWQLMHRFPTSADLKARVLETGLSLESNVQMKYSNIGYGVLGMLVEAVSGMPYRRYVDEHVVGHPDLALGNTFSEFAPAIEKRLVTGYTRRFGEREREAISKNVETGALAAATGFCSTGRDLAKFFGAHFIGSKSGLLDDASRKEMQHTQWPVRDRTAQREYGLGLTIEYAGKRRLFGHGGAFPGQRSCALADPADGTVVVVLCNFDEADPLAINKSVWGALDFFAERIAGPRPVRDGSRFEGIYTTTTWRALQIVASDTRIVAVHPDSWDPLKDAEDFEYVDASTLEVANVSAYLSEGELVRFKFRKNGTVESLNYAGATMWPEAEYYASRNARK
jgi:CubicO group peptidase (beta-lactamase class C family)